MTSTRSCSLVGAAWQSPSSQFGRVHPGVTESFTPGVIIFLQTRHCLCCGVEVAASVWIGEISFSSSWVLALVVVWTTALWLGLEANAAVWELAPQPILAGSLWLFSCVRYATLLRNAIYSSDARCMYYEITELFVFALKLTNNSKISGVVNWVKKIFVYHAIISQFKHKQKNSVAGVVDT